MKTMFLITILFAMSVANAAPMASDTTKEINAQTTITRGQIDNILDRINRTNNHTAFKASDYYAQSDAFKEKVERILRDFEEKIGKVILPKAAFWMDQYNSIYSSDEFSREQKQLILQERKNHISNQFKAISKEYQEALKFVYTLLPIPDSNPTFKYSPETLEYRSGTSIKQKIKVIMAISKDLTIEDEITYEAGKNKDREITLSDGSRVEVNYQDAGIHFKEFNSMFSKKYYDITLNFSEMYWLARKMTLNDNDKFNKIYYPAMKGACESSICVGLRAGDLLTLMTLIKSQIDRDIKLKLLDGSIMTLDGLYLNTYELSTHLSRVDYPEKLPFDL